MHALPNRGTLAAWCCSLCAAATLLGASSPTASRGHRFERVFSKPCGLEPCEGSLKKAAGVAIDETTGVVYVVDQGANRVARFSQSGTYLGELNGSGLIPGEETEAGVGGRAGERGGAGAKPGVRGRA